MIFKIYLELQLITKIRGQEEVNAVKLFKDATISDGNNLNLIVISQRHMLISLGYPLNKTVNEYITSY